jgi:hypothetical protein
MKLKHVLVKVCGNQTTLNQIVKGLQYCGLRIVDQRDQNLHVMVEEAPLNVDDNTATTLLRQLSLRVLFENTLKCQVRVHVVDEINDDFLEDFLNRSISINAKEEAIQKFFADTNDDKLPEHEDIFGSDRVQFLKEAETLLET